MAIANPLLEDISISGSRGILMNITASSSTLSMEEVDQASTMIHDEAHEDANIIWGAVFDEDAGDEIRVTVIATGIGADAVSREETIVTPIAELVRKRQDAGRDEHDQQLLISAYRDLKNRNGGSKRSEKQDSGKRSFDEINWDRYEIPTFIRKKAD